MKRLNPDEDRKLTGTGTYDIEAEYENDYYSDDFESDDEDQEQESGSTAMATGCSGSTLDSNAVRSLAET